MAIQNLLRLYFIEQPSIISSDLSIDSNSALRDHHYTLTNLYVELMKRWNIVLVSLFDLVGVIVALILDFRNPALAQYSGGTRFMIFMLETANTRFAGEVTRFCSG